MALRFQAVCSALLSALGAFLFGLDIGYIAPILACESFKRDVAGISDPKVGISDVTVGFIVGIFSLGCVLSSFPAVSGYFMGVWGRRDSIIIGTVTFLVGCVLQARATTLHSILVGRLVAGLSIGLLSPTVALYQSEVAPPNFRGALTCFYQLMITFGILVASIADHSLVGQKGGWRVAILLQAIPATALLVGMPLLPRSPRWLMMRGRKEEALAALLTLRGDQVEAEEELQEIAFACAAAQALGKPRWSELADGLLVRLVALGVGLQLLQQFVGMNAFMYFGPRIFGDLGLDQNKYQVITNTVNFLATFPAIVLADNFGRRALLIWGAAGMACASLGMGLLGVLAVRQEAGHWQASSARVSTSITGLILFFVASFSASWGPMVWVYTAEIFPLKYRSWCMGMTTTANWVGNYAIAQFTPVLLGYMGFGTFFIFGAFSVLALLVALWLPETKGIMLERMEAIFEDRFGLRSGRALEVGRRPSPYGSISKVPDPEAVSKAC